MRHSLRCLATVGLVLTPLMSTAHAQKAVAAGPQAGSTTIDFNALPAGTVVSNQYPGVTVGTGLCANNDYSFLGTSMAATNFLAFLTQPCDGVQGQPVTFFFSQSVNSFGGLWVTDGGNITFTTASGSIDVGLNDVGYNGFTDATPFSSVTVSVAGDGYFLVDDVSYTTSATPEPASLVLLGTGLVGVFGVARRRRRA